MEDRTTFVRIDKVNYYLNFAEVAAQRGTCIRNNYGCVIVKDDEIIATGYTGAPRGRKNCSDLGYCRRRKFNLPSGTGYDKCRSVHAEQNAIISAPRYRTLGSTLYLVGINARNGEYVTDNEPCSICKGLIINAGIRTVVMRDTKEKYRVENVSDWVENDNTLDII